MHFDELSKKMRAFESQNDDRISTETNLIARLDGRGFTRLTKELCRFETPFDPRFRDMMVVTARSLMTCGFNIKIGYCQSDEISLLFDRSDQQFGRKRQKYVSTLAGEASAALSLQLGRSATFDCRLVELPTDEHVVDYFRWRREDCSRNALNAWCYWTLRKRGENKRNATARLDGLSRKSKRELLTTFGIDPEALPTWQTRGISLTWEQYEKETVLQTHQTVVAQRRRIQVDYD